MAGIIKDRLVLPDGSEERGRIWQEHISPVFDIGFGRRTNLEAPMALEMNLCGEMVVGSVEAPVQRLARTPRKIAQQGLDHLLLQFYETGSSKVEGRGMTPVRASQVTVFDLSQPVEIEAEAVKALNLIIPRKVLVETLGNVDHLHGQAFDFATDPVRCMLHNYLRNILGTIEHIEPHQVAALSEAAAALCRACLPRAGEAVEPSGNGIRKLAIKQHVEKHIGASDLDVAHVMASFGVSRATLQRMFEYEGGFASYVRERRLQRAFATLARDGNTAEKRVAVVAHTHGFMEPSTFSRAFQRRFGLAPRDVTSYSIAAANSERDQATLLSFMNQI